MNTNMYVMQHIGPGYLHCVVVIDDVERDLLERVACLCVCELLLQDTDQSKISSAILCGSAVLAAALISTEVIHRRTCLRCFLGTCLGVIRKVVGGKSTTKYLR